MESPLSSDTERNREVWTEANAEFFDANGARQWASETIAWGTWGVPETSIGTLGAIEGLDVVELGCGTAYISAWLARRGARPVGIDITPAQLESARRLQGVHDLAFPLIEASAENVPLPDGSFDLAISEYGASIWCDPHKWIPEAHRLLRTGGRLWFLRFSTLSVLCMPEQGPPTERLFRPQRGLGRLDWGVEGVSWQLPTGELFGLMRRTGFEIVDLVELYPPDDAVPEPYFEVFSLEWARNWPAEEIWVAAKR